MVVAALLGSGLSLIAAGSAVDRFGPRLSTLVGTAIGAAGLALAAVVDSTGPLIAALALFGVGTSVVPIAGTSALFRAYPASRRAWALGVRQMAVPLGGTVAAVAMPLLVRAGGVQVVFVFGAALVAVTGCVFALIPEQALRSPGSRVPRAFRSIVRAQGMTRLLVVAAFYIVVLQAVLAFTVPAVRSAGLVGQSRRRPISRSTSRRWSPGCSGARSPTGRKETDARALWSRLVWWPRPARSCSRSPSMLALSL